MTKNLTHLNIYQNMTNKILIKVTKFLNLTTSRKKGKKVNKMFCSAQI